MMNEILFLKKMKGGSHEASDRMTSFCFLFEVVSKNMKDQVICECFSGTGREMRHNGVPEKPPRV